MHRLMLLALTCLTVAGLAWSGPSAPVLMEAKLYVSDVQDLDHLGTIAGDLYICSRGADEKGTYLVLVTDADQLGRIRDCGLETAVTWANLDDKFKLLTGVDPHDALRLQTFGYYFTYWEMRDSLEALAAAHPEVCSLFAIGVTSQGRDILCMKVSGNAATEEDEPACYFSGACHGDEPIGTSIVMAFLEEILAGYGTDSLCTWLVNNREIYTVPILNPDCSIYCSDSGGAGVYWRKNRRVVVPPNIGVDPSRNHGFKWGYDDVGSSPNPAAHAYRGPFPWSDAEASAARDLSLSHRFRTEQDFHAYGRWNMYPWSYDTFTPPDEAALREANDSLRMYNGYPESQAGQISRAFYPCNGTQPDWALTDTAGKFMTYSFDIEADTWFYACWNDSALMREEVEGNVPGLFYLARIAGAYLIPIAVTVNDSVLGNATGMLDPGETANIWFTIRNQAIHPLDSAYSISARLISLDTLVAVIDSVKAFPSVQRRSNVDNIADQFVVRASGFGHPGDTVRFRLEVTYTDADNTMVMLVPSEVVLGEDVIGIYEAGNSQGGSAVMPATVIGRVLFLSGQEGRTETRPALRDALGRRVMVLMPGANDVSRLSTGVYFTAGGEARGVSAFRRLLVIR
ncbi:zinc carboxypeptidase [candidate division WOR-3 bacterium]|uniref:Zinc carboxypeptidase n=1 Tax=candidate division WOR-3 bacterium TaxID=2052148 RepID=A0A937XBP3_UNCW3|nr:zinc carboxypeptidase [candidate division WOR-3 bacterium]